MPPKRGKHGAVTRATQAKLLAAQKKEKNFEVQVQEINCEPDPNIDYSKFPPMSKQEYEKKMMATLRQLCVIESEFKSSIGLLRKTKLNAIKKKREAINNGTDSDFRDKASVFERARDEKTDAINKALTIKAASLQRVQNANISFLETKYRDHEAQAEIKQAEKELQRQKTNINVVTFHKKQLAAARWKIFNRNRALKAGKIVKRFKPNYVRLDSYRRLLKYPLMVNKLTKTEIENDVELAQNIILDHDIRQEYEQDLAESPQQCLSPNYPEDVENVFDDSILLDDPVQAVAVDPITEPVNVKFEIFTDPYEEQEQRVFSTRSKTAAYNKAIKAEIKTEPDIPQKVTGTRSSRNSLKTEIIQDIPQKASSTSYYNTRIKTEIKTEPESPEKEKPSSVSTTYTSYTTNIPIKTEAISPPEELEQVEEPVPNVSENQGKIAEESVNDLTIKKQEGTEFSQPVFLNKLAEKSVKIMDRRKQLLKELEELKKQEKLRLELKKKGIIMRHKRRESVPSEAKKVKLTKVKKVKLSEVKKVKASELQKVKPKITVVKKPVCSILKKKQADEVSTKASVKKSVSFKKPIAVRKIISFEPRTHIKTRTWSYILQASQRLKERRNRKRGLEPDGTPIQTNKEADSEQQAEGTSLVEASKSIEGAVDEVEMVDLAATPNIQNGANNGQLRSTVSVLKKKKKKFRTELGTKIIIEYFPRRRAELLKKAEKLASKKTVAVETVAEPNISGQVSVEKSADGETAPAQTVDGKVTAQTIIGEKTTFGKVTVEPTVGELDVLVKALTEQPAAEKPISGKITAGQTVSGKKISGKAVVGQTATDKSVTGKTITGGKTVSGKDAGGKIEQTVGEQAVAGKIVSGQTVGGQAAAIKSSSKKAIDEQTLGAKTISEKTAGRKIEQVVAKKTITGQTNLKKSISGKTTVGQTVDGKTVTEQTTVAGQSVNGQTAAETSISGKTPTEQTVSEQTVTDKVVAEQTIVGKTAAGKSAAKKTIAGKAAAGKAEKIVGEQTTAEKTLIEKITVGQTAVGETVSGEILPGKMLAATTTVAAEAVAETTILGSSVNRTTAAAEKIIAGKVIPGNTTLVQIVSEKAATEEATTEEIILRKEAPGETEPTKNLVGTEESQEEVKPIIKAKKSTKKTCKEMETSIVSEGSKEEKATEEKPEEEYEPIPKKKKLDLEKEMTEQGDKSKLEKTTGKDKKSKLGMATDTVETSTMETALGKNSTVDLMTMVAKAEQSKLLEASTSKIEKPIKEYIDTAVQPEINRRTEKRKQEEFDNAYIDNMHVKEKKIKLGETVEKEEKHMLKEMTKKYKKSKNDQARHDTDEKFKEDESLMPIQNLKKEKSKKVVEEAMKEEKSKKDEMKAEVKLEMEKIAKQKEKQAKDKEDKIKEKLEKTKENEKEEKEKLKKEEEKLMEKERLKELEEKAKEKLGEKDEKTKEMERLSKEEEAKEKERLKKNEEKEMEKLRKEEEKAKEKLKREEKKAMEKLRKEEEKAKEKLRKEEEKAKAKEKQEREREAKAKAKVEKAREMEEKAKERAREKEQKAKEREEKAKEREEKAKEKLREKEEKEQRKKETEKAKEIEKLRKEEEKARQEEIKKTGELVKKEESPKKSIEKPKFRREDNFKKWKEWKEIEKRRDEERKNDIIEDDEQDKPKREDPYYKDETWKPKGKYMSKKEIEKAKAREKAKKEAEAEVKKGRELLKKIKEEPIDLDEAAQADRPSTSKATRNQVNLDKVKIEADIPIVSALVPARKAASVAAAKMSQKQTLNFAAPKKTYYIKKKQREKQMARDIADKEIKEELLTAAEMEAQQQSSSRSHKK